MKYWYAVNSCGLDKTDAIDSLKRNPYMKNPEYIEYLKIREIQKQHEKEEREKREKEEREQVLLRMLANQPQPISQMANLQMSQLLANRPELSQLLAQPLAVNQLLVNQPPAMVNQLLGNHHPVTVNQLLATQQPVSPSQINSPVRAAAEASQPKMSHLVK